jgi:tRNA pseudouridine38-40 synthase
MVFGHEAPIYLAGRTDRGVHAAGQVASFASPPRPLELARIVPALNDHLDRDIAVVRASRKPVGFHARYSAKWREYRYRLWSGARQPLAEGFIWTLRGSVDIDAMRHGARALVGEHDFSSFASGGEGVPGSPRGTRTRGAVRTVLECDVRVVPAWWGADSTIGTLIELRVVADGFLPRMVRGIAGALAEVGRGAISAEELGRLIAARDRRLAPMNAPPHGLVLWAVGYEPYRVEHDQTFAGIG